MTKNWLCLVKKYKKKTRKRTERSKFTWLKLYILDRVESPLRMTPSTAAILLFIHKNLCKRSLTSAIFYFFYFFPFNYSVIYWIVYRNVPWLHIHRKYPLDWPFVCSVGWFWGMITNSQGAVTGQWTLMDVWLLLRDTWNDQSMNYSCSRHGRWRDNQTIKTLHYVTVNLKISNSFQVYYFGWWAVDKKWCV